MRDYTTGPSHGEDQRTAQVGCRNSTKEPRPPAGDRGSPCIEEGTHGHLSELQTRGRLTCQSGGIKDMPVPKIIPLIRNYWSKILPQ